MKANRSLHNSTAPADSTPSSMSQRLTYGHPNGPRVVFVARDGQDHASPPARTAASTAFSANYRDTSREAADSSSHEEIHFKNPFASARGRGAQSFLETLANAPIVSDPNQDGAHLSTYPRGFEHSLCSSATPPAASAPTTKERKPFFLHRPRSSSVPKESVTRKPSISKQRRPSVDEHQRARNQSTSISTTRSPTMRPSLSAPHPILIAPNDPTHSHRARKLSEPVPQVSFVDGPRTVSACEAYTFPKPRIIPKGSPPGLGHEDKDPSFAWLSRPVAFERDVQVGDDTSSMRRVLRENEQSQKERQEWSSEWESSVKGRDSASRHSRRGISRMRRPSLKRLFADRHDRADSTSEEETRSHQRTPRRSSSLPQFAAPAPSPPIPHSFRGLARSNRSKATSSSSSKKRQGTAATSISANTFGSSRAASSSLDVNASSDDDCSTRTRYFGEKPIRHLRGSPSVDSLAPRWNAIGPTRLEFGQAIRADADDDSEPPQAYSSPGRRPTLQNQNAAISLPPHLHHVLRTPEQHHSRRDQEVDHSAFEPSRKAPDVPLVKRHPALLDENWFRPASMNSVQLCLALSDRLEHDHEGVPASTVDQENAVIATLEPRPPIVERDEIVAPISSAFPPRPATRPWSRPREPRLESNDVGMHPVWKRKSRDELATRTRERTLSSSSEDALSVKGERRRRRTTSIDQAYTSVQSSVKENVDTGRVGRIAAVKGLALVSDDPFARTVRSQRSLEFSAQVTSPVRSDFSDDIVDLDDTGNITFDGLFFSPPAPSSSGHQNDANRRDILSNMSLHSDRTSLASSSTGRRLPLGVITEPPTSAGSPVVNGRQMGLQEGVDPGDHTFGPGHHDVTQAPSETASTAYETALEDDLFSEARDDDENDHAATLYRFDDVSLAPMYPRSEVALFFDQDGTFERETRLSRRITNTDSPSQTSFLELSDDDQRQSLRVTLSSASTGSKPRSEVTSVKAASEHDSFLNFDGEDHDEASAGQIVKNSDRTGKHDAGTRPTSLMPAAILRPESAPLLKSPMGASFVSELLHGDTAMEHFPTPPSDTGNMNQRDLIDQQEQDQRTGGTSWLVVGDDDEGYRRDLYW
ncbi:hypothetical protein OIO90_003992 [Microbotryomycetes sp. JL221]|nr:hypothetical protein OIO90_003992 [Microbotryomycetes sp. JL221]